jgi:hypothetical protein
MQALCAYESVALGTSEFCNLFTPTEWKDFTYANDLGKPREDYFLLCFYLQYPFLLKSHVQLVPQSFGTRPALVILIRLHLVRGGRKN